MTTIATVQTHNSPKYLKGMTNNVGLTSVLVTLYDGLQIVSNKTIRIGDTQHHINVVMIKGLNSWREGGVP